MAEEELNEAKQAHRSVSSEAESSCGCGCNAADEAIGMMPDERTALRFGPTCSRCLATLRASKSSTPL